MSPSTASVTRARTAVRTAYRPVAAAGRGRLSNPEVTTVVVLGLAVRIKAVSPGTATVTVVATGTDPGGLSATMDFQVTVTKSGPG